MKEVKIKVNGMICSGCENRVKNVVSDIDGVKSVKSDFKTGMVTIILENNVNISLIEQKIEDLGFEVINKNIKED